MALKATYIGTCQVCGSEQMLPGGLLSLHGYTVEHHFFEGVCPGAKAKPLETDRVLADKVAADLLAQSVFLANEAKRFTAGEILPAFASAGFRCATRESRYSTQEVMVPFEDAAPDYQASAVRAAAANAESQSKLAKRISEAITARADKTTGKIELRPRVEEARKEIGPGTIVKLNGRERVVDRVEYRVARGCGPYMNGNSMPHAVFVAEDGREWAYPVRLIRQKSIVGVAS